MKFEVNRKEARQSLNFRGDFLSYEITVIRLDRYKKYERNILGTVLQNNYKKI